jgi:cytochrome c peroxidase
MKKVWIFWSVSLCLWASDPLFTPLPEAVSVDTQKAKLGERLFHDPGLSKDGTISCATCHPLNRYGVDALPVSVGIKGQSGRFNAPTVYNAAFQLAQFWDGRANSLADQAGDPIVDPVEMGNDWSSVIEYLKTDTAYRETFRVLYDRVSPEGVRDALAVFQKGLITPDSPFDRYLKGERSALNEPQRRGLELFRARGCVSCHNGINLGGNLYQRSGVMIPMPFTRQADAWPGRMAITGEAADRFHMKVPPLRNVAQTAPYFHNGSVKTLSEAVELMGWHQLGRELKSDEVADLVAFLKSLTGKLPDAYAQ